MVEMTSNSRLLGLGLGRDGTGRDGTGRNGRGREWHREMRVKEGKGEERTIEKEIEAEMINGWLIN